MACSNFFLVKYWIFQNLCYNFINRKPENIKWRIRVSYTREKRWIFEVRFFDLFIFYCFFSFSPLMDCYFYTSANGEWQVVVCDLCFFFIISINGLIFIHFCKWRFWDIYIRKDACSLRSRLSLFWYPAISQFCDSIIRIAYHTAIYKYGYTIIHGCDGDGFSHPVTDHDATRKKATAAEKKRMAGTIMESGK